MNREDWEYSTHSLRKLLHKFHEEDGFEHGRDRAVEYRFGVQFNPMFDFYNLYDAIEGSSIATIALKGETRGGTYKEHMLMRYLPTTPFKYELGKFRMPDKKHIFLPSDNVVRHDGWVRNNLHSRCERAIRERRDFLEVQRLATSPNIFTISIPTITSPTQWGLSGHIAGLTQSDTLRVRVDFGHPPTDTEQTDVFGMVTWMTRNSDWRFNPTAIVPFTELVEIYQQYRRMHAERQSVEEYESRHSNRNFQRYAQQFQGYQRNVDTMTDSYMGRPLDQIRNELAGMLAEGVAPTEENMMQAVTRLDEAGVPAEHGAVRVRSPRELREMPMQTGSYGVMPAFYEQEYTQTDSGTTIGTWNREAMQRLVQEMPEVQMNTTVNVGTSLTEEMLRTTFETLNGTDNTTRGRRDNV